MGSCARQTPMPEVLDFFEGPCDASVLPDSGNGLEGQVLGDRTAGLHNLGNTCFMNTALQCLANLPDVREAISAKQSQPAFSDLVVDEFHKLMQALWDHRSGPVSPSALRDSISRCTSSFTDWEQHDAMEFLEFLINRLAEGCKDQKEPGEAAFSSLQEGGQGSHTATSQLQSCRELCALSLFSGSLKTTITCPENSCRTKSAKVESITSVKLPSIDPKLSEQDSVEVVVVPAASSESPIVEHKVFVERSATFRMLLDRVSTKAKLARNVCLCASLEDGRLQICSEEDGLGREGRGRGPFLVYELEAADEALCVKLRSGKEEISGDGERRVCPDDGITYTFHELRAAFGSEYSAEDLRSYWCDAMALAPSAVPAGAQSAVIVHCRLDSLRQNGRILVGLPLLFAMDRITSQAQLVDAIRVQLMLRYKLEDASGWSLYQTSAGWNAAKADTLLGHEASPNSDQLALRECEHLVVHWGDPAQPAPDQLLSTCNKVTEDAEDIYSLYTCFDWLTATQQLSTDNAVLCNGCQQRVEALSRVQLAGAPPVLVLHLNRFEYKYGQRNRLFTSIHFPVDGLDLTRFCTASDEEGRVDQAPPIYDLLATIIHAGSACIGHYTSCIRSWRGVWYLYNDETVKQVLADDVQDTRGTYVLFYLRRDRRPEGWGSLS
mmetsp:Transcript_3609/g.8720  ORF Transcript_3609/g.8720 Transcript_3609/m.8720 type:complete len:665 (+) Transcript_3609:133-2127(+)